MHLLDVWIDIFDSITCSLFKFCHDEYNLRVYLYISHRTECLLVIKLANFIVVMLLYNSLTVWDALNRAFHLIFNDSLM